MSARERWLVSHVEGECIADIGFAGEKPALPAYFAHLKNTRRDSLLIGVDSDQHAVLGRGQKGSLVGDAFGLPFRTKSIDCVILGEFVEHHSEISSVLEECHRVLKVGGRLLITTPNPHFVNRLVKAWLLRSRRGLIREANIRAAMGDAGHLVLWDPLSLCNLLSRVGFRVEEATTLGLWVPYIGRLIPAFRLGLSLDVWPLNRMGHITCIRCIKVRIF